MALVADRATTTTLSVSWRDYTYDEDGFVVAIKADGDYREAGRTSAHATSYVLTGLEPATKYTISVRAFKSEKLSEAAELTVSTRPVEAGVLDIYTYQPDYTWTSGDFLKSEADGKNVLLAPRSDATLTLSETVEPKAMVYKEVAHLTVDGAAIGGETSVNKGGEGILTLTGNNTYHGATVVHDGILEFSTLKNGGEASSIGASVEYAQNWIFDGGTYRYTGGTTSTNRSLKLSSTSTFDIKSATVTMNGIAEGADMASDFIIDGDGQMTIGTTKFFGYKGATILKGSTLYLSTTDISKAGIGSSAKLVMAGGHLKTKGESSGYETYAFPIEVEEGTTSQFSPNRNCYINSRVTGAGIIQLNIPYLREYVQGDWSLFRGRLIANGISTDKRGSLLLLDKSPKLDHTVIELKGNASMCYWSTNGNLTIGGLSGSTGTYLNGSSKQTNNFTCTWTVGSANTDETFHGTINNWSVSGSGHVGTVNIVKTGTGIWRLTGANDYKGATQIESGTLVVNGHHIGTGAITVQSGAVLAGKGTLTGATTIHAGGILQVGDTLATDHGLTLKGGLKLDNGAILRLNDAMMETTYKHGDEIKVFTGTVSGTFSEIQPATPGEGLGWDSSHLYDTGYLIVTSDETGIQETKTGKSVIGKSFDLQGRRTNTSQKGIIINNGKRVIRK